MKDSYGMWLQVEVIYHLKEIFDAGSIQELRIASKVQAYGLDQNDVMETWVPFASAIPLASANRADWDAWLEVSTSDDSIVMADWVPLNNANGCPDRCSFCRMVTLETC